jgi:thioredoxin 1
MAQEFTDDNFAKEVLQADKPVLVDFWAPWCGPCKMIGPIIEKLSTELATQVKIGKLNVDDNQATAGEYNVMSIPTLLLFKNGKVVDQAMGFTPEPRLRAFIAQHVGAAQAH